MVAPCPEMEGRLVGVREWELLEGLYECERERRRLEGVDERARDVLEGVYNRLLLCPLDLDLKRVVRGEGDEDNEDEDVEYLRPLPLCLSRGSRGGG